MTSVMKKGICVTTALLLVLVSMLIPMTAVAAGTLQVTASASSVTVGNTFTVKLTYNGGGMTVGSIDARVTYDAACFQYVSCSGANGNGGAGVVVLSWFAEGVNAPSSTTISLSFKAIGAGEGAFSVSTADFWSDDNGDLGAPSGSVTVKSANPTLSGNANLSSLYPSMGTLVPAFQPDVTAYSVTVPYTVTSLSLSAKAAQAGAKVAVTGSNTLAVGKNTQSVRVTAPNGTVKTYTVVIVRSADDGSGDTVSGDPTDAGSNTDLEVTVNGTAMRVSDVQPDVALPAGFEWTSVTLNETQVSAAVSKDNGLTLLYLTDTASEKSALYIYDEGKPEPFTVFEPLETVGKVYALLAMPEEIAAPAGTVAGTYTFGSVTADVWKYEDAAWEDLLIVYAAGPGNYIGLYSYDRTDGSMQRFREKAAVPAEPEPEPAEETPAFLSRVRDFAVSHRDLLLLIAACAALLAVIIILIVRGVSRKNRECRH